MRRALHTLVVLASCLPEAPPPWQVDHTIVAALPVEVAARGPWAADPPRADRRLSELMPGDTLRPAPFVIGPDGPAEVQPRYFYCDLARCVADVGQPGGVRDCEEVEAVPPTSTCELRGGALRLGELTRLLHNTALLMIAGTPEGPGATTCVRRLRGEDDSESLRECLLRVDLLRFGPTWRLLVYAALRGLADAVPLDAITPAVTATDPNLFPGEPGLTVRVRAGDEPTRTLAAERGAVVQVARGAQIAITAEVDPADAQGYWFVDGDGGFASTYESLTVGWLFTEDVAWSSPDVLSVVFTAPDVPGPLFVYALLGDGSGITPTWLRFEVAD